MRTWLKRWLPRPLQPSVIARSFLDRRLTDREVLSGPFRGMRYVDTSVGSVYVPKVLGTYECELHTIIAEVCRRQRPRVVLIGAAEGYYAVGLARCCPTARVVAYELQVEGQRLIREMSARNGVSERLDVRGECSVEELASLCGSCAPDFLMVDVEGAEFELLDPVRAPGLNQSTVLVELHPWVVGGIEEELRRRFTGSHDIATIHTRPRVVGDLPFSRMTRSFLGRWLIPFTSEYRPSPMKWLHLVPRT